MVNPRGHHSLNRALTAGSLHHRKPKTKPSLNLTAGSVEPPANPYENEGGSHAPRPWYRKKEEILSSRLR